MMNNNKFSVLQDYTEMRKREDSNSQKMAEDSQKPLVEVNEYVFNSFNHFMKNIKYFSHFMNDDSYSVYIKNNKNTSYTGYSLDSFNPIFDSKIKSSANIHGTNVEFLSSNNMIQVLALEVSMILSILKT